MRLPPELLGEIPWPGPGAGLEWQLVVTDVSDALVLLEPDGAVLEMAWLGVGYLDDVVVACAEKLFINYLFGEE